MSRFSLPPRQRSSVATRKSPRAGRCCVDNALLAALVFLASFGLSLDGLARTQEDAAGVTFVVADTVSAEDAWLVRESIRFAQDYVGTALGARIDQRFRVEIGTTPDPPSSAYARGDTIVVSPDHRVWREYSPLNRAKIVVHEYFHIVQQALTGQQYHPGPIWLLEGAAEYVAYRAVSDAGLVDFGVVLDRWIGDGLHGSLRGVPLSDIESGSASPDLLCCIYELAPMAVHVLVEERGAGAIAGYYQAIGRGTAWREAFALAFGQTLEEFYTAFEGSRNGYQVAGFDTSPVGFPSFASGGSGGFEPLVYPSTLDQGEQAIIAGQSVWGAACTLTIRSAIGQSIEVLPTVAGVDGRVFWFWTTPVELDAQVVTAAIGCGAGEVVLEVQVGVPGMSIPATPTGA